MSFERLVHLLDSHRPGDDASALAALVPLARRRADPELLARLARCFVDSRLTTLPGHYMSAPADRAGLGLAPERLAAFVSSLLQNYGEKWRVGLRNVTDADTRERFEGGVALLHALERDPTAPLEAPALEATAWRLALGGERFRMVDRWVEQGGVELAARIMADATGWLTRMAIVEGVTGYELVRLEPETPRNLDGDGVLRLRAWLCVEPGLAPDAATLLDALTRGLANGTPGLDAAQAEAIVALWLADLDAAFLDAVLERVRDERDPRRPRSGVALNWLVAALRPRHTDALGELLAELPTADEHLGMILPALADRFGQDAFAPLVAWRERASHHKYISLAAHALARIPGTATIRIFAAELGHKSTSRSDDARTACLLQPVEALATLPGVLVELAADTTRKGKAERERHHAAVLAMLDELAQVQPLVTWILLPTLADAELAQRLTERIPESYRRDPDGDEAFAGADRHDWLMAWNVSPTAKLPPLFGDDLVLADAAGEFSREHLRRLVLGLGERTGLAARLDELAEHFEPDALRAFADLLLAAWSERGRQRYDELWVVRVAARFGNGATLAALRALLASLESRKRELRFEGALGELHGVAPAVFLEIVGLLRLETRRDALRQLLDVELARFLDRIGGNPLRAAPLPFADGALPPKTKKARERLGATLVALAEDLLELAMVRTTPAERDWIATHWLAHPVVGPALADRVLWGRFEDGQLIEIVGGRLRDAPDGDYAPLHPAQVDRERFAEVLAALRASGAEPLRWQAERPVWREGDRLPFAQPQPVPRWALEHLLDRCGWHREGGALAELYPANRLAQTMRAPLTGAGVELRLATSAERPMDEVLVELHRAAGTHAVATSEALRDLQWLERIPATGAGLKSWRESLGLDLAALAERWDVPLDIVRNWEQQTTLYAADNLVAAFASERC